jgi:hypothetical protein
MCNRRMIIFLEAQGYDVWYLVVIGYTTSKKHLNIVAKKELKRNKKVAMDYLIW